MLRLWKKTILCLLAVVLVLSFLAQAQGMNADCPGYSFASIDGKTITPDTNAGKVTLIIFSHLSQVHGHDDTLIHNLLSAEWLGNPNLSVLVVDWAGGSVDDVRAFAQTVGAENTDLTMCADPNDTFWRFLDAVGASSSFSTPVSIVVGKDGKIKNHMMGETSELAFRKLLHSFVDGIDPIPTTTLSITGEQGYSEAFKIVELINEQRKAKGLSAVKMDKELLDAAMLRAAECAVYYSHTRPDGSRCFTAFPAGGGSSAENIAIGQQSAEEVMTAWMNSQGHRENILTEAFASVGVGVFYHEGVYTWVQLFSSNAATTPKKPADATKTVTIEALQEHIVPRAERTLLMLQKGGSQTVRFYFSNRGFDPLAVMPDSANLTFTSSNPKIAKVNAKGVVTAIANGTAEITATLNGTDKQATVKIEVTEHDYQEWSYDPAECAAAGHARYKCADCGEWIDRELPKLTEHFWDSGTLVRRPTTSKDGEKFYTCTFCGATKTESIPKFFALKPAPTQPSTAPATKAPTTPATQAPTVPATKAPTVPATKEPTIPATKAPTVPPTAAPTVPATPAATVPLTAAPTLPTTAPETAPTEPATIPSEPTQAPTEITAEPTAPAQTEPTSAPETNPTQAATQIATEPENLPAEEPDNKLIIAIAVAVAATLAAGAFLIFWKRKK